MGLSGKFFNVRTRHLAPLSHAREMRNDMSVVMVLEELIIQGVVINWRCQFREERLFYRFVFALACPDKKGCHKKTSRRVKVGPERAFDRLPQQHRVRKVLVDTPLTQKLPHAGRRIVCNRTVRMP